MQSRLSSQWFKRTVYFTLGAILFTFVPFFPLAGAGGLALLAILPGAQLMRWLGLFKQRWDFAQVVFSVVLGMVTSPILIYWSSLLFGLSRWLLLIVFPLYIVALAAWVSRNDPTPPPFPPAEPADATPRTWWVAALLIGVTALGVFLAYFELETAQGYYPVQMEDWQKHYGVAFALRYTGIPPTSMFFYGMFPHDELVYYYFLHLNGAALDLLHSGGPMLHHTFVIFIVLASLGFSSVFFLLARTVLGSQKAAVWSLAFVTVIGGLDVVPIVHRTIQKYREHFPDGPLPAGVFLPREHIDNWVSALSLRLNTFFAHHIWVPQHLTGLTILCLGCYLYLKVTDRRKLLVIMPLLLFALLGHSTWIAAVVAGCLFLFGLGQVVAAYRQQGWAPARRLFMGYAFIALAFGVVAAPFILSLLGPHAPKSGLVFEIPRLDSWPLLRPIQAYFGDALWARLLDLPLHFFIELGALLVAGLAGLILFWQNKPVDLQTGQPRSFAPFPPPSSLLPFWTLLLLAGLLTVSFFASGRGWADLGLLLNNDLGLRAIMPGQLVLGLFAGYFMARLSTLARWGRVVLAAGLGLLLVLGVAYAGWEFIAMGLAKYWSEPALGPDVYQSLRALPEVTYAQDKLLPVVQHRLYRGAPRFQLSLGSRPVSFATGEAVVFHQALPELALAHTLSQQAFDNGLPLWSYQLFRNLGADYAFVGPAERETMRHPEKYAHAQYFQPVYRQGDFALYQVKPALYAGQAQATFDQGAIEFWGYFVDHQPVYPGADPVSPGDNAGQGLVTAWRLTRPAEKNYTVYLHLVDPAGQVLAQADHQLWAWDVRSEGPTATWTPKLMHLDITPLPVAVLSAATPLTLRLGLWLPDSGQHFPVESTLLVVDEEGRLVVGAWPRPSQP